jgi:putative flippase GtrA
MITLFGRYVFVGLLGYMFLSLSSILVQRFSGVSQVSAYGVSLLFLYLFDYLLNARYVFQVGFNRSHFFLYPLYLVLSWGFGVCSFFFFQLFISDILLTTALTTVTLFPIRFILNFLLFKRA